MRNFKIPYGKIVPDKIIGGILTPKESVYAGSILFVFSILFIIDNSYITNGISTISVVIRIIILLIYAIFAVTFIIVKKDIYDLDEYLILKLKFKYKNNKVIYEKY